ncbi:uncharacterized protein EI90DRAFT_3047499 [Cantharellus anzutake]|uniref:uncharacterized protein n=1 Tax=Cantharellus anzutake TaxID=1750568 RepID=UPI00190860FB|nr:uncharacterized protein EI90DRAFT_3047499 [Cantharellus anzutake]KAF8335907.1 hypothetical protein EI90DRAFT_3047499 [Cantharellus anzutake]
MPLNSIPPTTTVGNLETKRAAALGQCWTDVGFWGGVIPGNQGNLRSLIDAGVKGFKCFMIESGVEEFPCVSEDDLNKAAPEIAGRSVLLFHAEVDDSSNHSDDDLTDPNPDRTSYTTLLKRFPHLDAHIVHLSTAAALPLIRQAKEASLKLTVETCFHYLCLASHAIPMGNQNSNANNQDELWAALDSGLIDCVVSDHSPCVAELKRSVTASGDGDFISAWGGISTLGLGLSLLWTEGVRKRQIKPGKVVRWISEASAKHGRINDTKGSIAVGKDGDLVVFDPEEQFMLTPYAGSHVYGQVKQVYIRGN